MQSYPRSFYSSFSETSYRILSVILSPWYTQKSFLRYSHIWSSRLLSFQPIFCDRCTDSSKPSDCSDCPDHVHPFCSPDSSADFPSELLVRAVCTKREQSQNPRRRSCVRYHRLSVRRSSSDVSEKSGTVPHTVFSSAYARSRLTSQLLFCSRRTENGICQTYHSQKRHKPHRLSRHYAKQCRMPLSHA